MLSAGSNGGTVSVCLAGSALSHMPLRCGYVPAAFGRKHGVPRSPLCAEIIVIMFSVFLRICQRRIQRRDRRHADRSRRQTRIPIRVVRRVVCQVPVQHPPNRRVAQRELDRRVRLERYSRTQAVDIDARHLRHLAAELRLFDHDRSDRRDLLRRQVQFSAFARRSSFQNRSCSFCILVTNSRGVIVQ